ncbi:MAG: response regulator transcription factor [Acidobacteriota bacterium]
MHLRDAGHEVQVAHDGRTGSRRADAGEHDLVILDLMLPDMDGLEICKRLRSRPDYTPILMLTARSGELDRVLGLEVGADDYLTKPFSIRELLARVKALFRRIEALAAEQPAQEDRPVAIGDLRIDPVKRTVVVGDRPVELTAREFDLLAQFARHPGRAYTRAELLDLVWGYGHDGYEHTVNTHINRLRSKIETDPSRPRHILTVWGVGYKLAEPGLEG